MKYQAEVEEANPVSSFSLPPDTPAPAEATSFTDQASDSSTDAHSLPTLPSFDSEPGAPAAVWSNQLRQPVFGHAAFDCQHSMNAQPSAVPTLVRLLSPRRKSVGQRPVPSLSSFRQPAAGSTKPRVIADSATILSFAELRRSMEAAADQSDEDSD